MQTSSEGLTDAVHGLPQATKRVIVQLSGSMYSIAPPYVIVNIL
jgi:hypothetical protein